MSNAARFVLATCQRGAEAALKNEIAQLWPDWRFSFSRPGFLTFKLPAELLIAEDFELGSVFARAYGFSLGTVAVASPPVDEVVPGPGEPSSPTGTETPNQTTSDSDRDADREPPAPHPSQTDLAAAAAAVWNLAGELPVECVHVWSRDRFAAGFHGYEPGPTAGDSQARQQLLAARHLPADQPALAKPGQLVLDCIRTESSQWWVGYHRAYQWASCRPGGFFEQPLPEHAVSRAYLKMSEALAWSQLPLRPGELAAEIGCAPGGSTQALLDRGLRVLGIDPAKVDPAVLEHPQFTWLRKRGHEVRLRELRKVRWLSADLNVAPDYTLDTVERIVCFPQSEVRGLLLTLKLPDWRLAVAVPGYLNRVRSWGFSQVRARQLHHNRQEICVAAQGRSR